MLEPWRLQAGVRRGLWVLALLVLLSQSLGLAHRFVHASSLGTSHVQTMADASQDELAMPGSATPASWGWVFGDHKSAVDCQLYDQLCHDALGLAWVVMLAFALPKAGLCWVLRERFALHARFFSARAPPAVLN